MKSTSRHFLQKLLVNDYVYKILTPFLFIAERLKASRYDYLNAPAYAALKARADKIFADKVVCNGPFKGLKFDREAGQSGSTYAMLLGSFESEIHPHIYAASQRQYDALYNIGCADGYYAAGFARLMPGTTIYAFDTDKRALAMAKKLAMQNEVQDAIHFAGTFYAQNVEQVNPEKRSLFIVDCEGAERNIFTRENVGKLIHADLIIEMHINIYPDLEEYFTALFGATHHIAIVNSVDDHLKAKTYNYPQLDGLDYNLKYFITEERAIFMQWIILSSKKLA
jgi:hypothetical protein